jgi:excisionase family DNA binding protein
MEKLLTIEEVSELLQIPKGSLYNLVHEDRIPHVKIGGRLRFRTSTLEKWVLGQEKQEQRPLRVEL